MMIEFDFDIEERKIHKAFKINNEVEILLDKEERFRDFENIPKNPSEIDLLKMELYFLAELIKEYEENMEFDLNYISSFRENNFDKQLVENAEITNIIDTLEEKFKYKNVIDKFEAESFILSHLQSRYFLLLSKITNNIAKKKAEEIE